MRLRTTRLARARASLHSAIDAYLDALEAEGEDDHADADAASPSKPASRPTRPRIVRPAGESDELAKAKARRFLRDNGLAQVNR